MKLSYIALIFLLSTVAGNHPSPARRVGHGAQRSNVVKHNVGHSSGGTGRLIMHHPTTGKSSNSNSGKVGKTQQEQNVIQPTRSPNLNSSAGKSVNSNSGKDRKTQQQQKDTVQRTPQLNTSTEKADNFNSDRDGKTQQLRNAAQNTPTSTLKPTAEKSSNSSSAKAGETPLQQHNYSSKTEAHHHYHYSPPQQISYGSTYHPVYQGHPPVYVYEYRDSGSRFDNLLTGLALYNLGRNSHSHHYSSERQYSGTPGEICKLGISKRTGEYEETRIDCNLMSSFIWEDTTSTTRNEQHVVKNITEVKVTQTVNGTGNSSVTTASVTSNTVEDALKVKGPSITVTPGMTCYMIRTVRDTTALRKPVDCGLLQEYERSSLFQNSAQCLMPLMALNLLIICIGLRIDEWIL